MVDNNISVKNNDIKGSVLVSNLSEIRAQYIEGRVAEFDEQNRLEAEVQKQQQEKAQQVAEPLTEQQVAELISLMEQTAENAPVLELTPENWEKEFGEDGMVETPVGKVKMGENQYFKLVKNKRENQFGMIKPTLTNPDVIIEKHAPEENSERETKLLFIKTFTNSSGEKYIHFESVTVQKDGLEVSVSNHIADTKAIAKELINGTIAYNKFANRSERYLPENQNGLSDIVPTQANSTDKSNKNNSDTQIFEEKKQAFMDSLPKNKKGEIDYDRIQDAKTYKEALKHEFGDKAVNLLAKVYAKAQKDLEKANKTEDPFKEARAVAEMEAKLAFLEEVKAEFEKNLEASKSDRDDSDDNGTPPPGAGGAGAVETQGTQGTAQTQQDGTWVTQPDPKSGNGKKKTPFNTAIDQIFAGNTEGLQQQFFDVAQTPEFMKKLGITGDIFTLSYGVISRHINKDSDHRLTPDIWKQLPEAIQKPFAITKYGDKDNSYRLYTAIQVGDGYVVVGVDVKKVGKNIDINSISTVFNREGGITNKENVIYKSETITPQQEVLLAKPSSPPYQPDKELSSDKSSENNSDGKTKSKEKPKKDVLFEKFTGSGLRFQTEYSKELDAADKRFNGELDDFKAKTHKGLLHLGSPLEILKAAGVNVKELTLSPTLLNKKLKEHNLTVEDLKGLAKSMQNPMFVYEHGLKNPNIVIVTEMEVRGKKLAVAIELDNTGNVVEINNISSIHGKDAAIELERLSKAADYEKGLNFKWISDKEKVLSWLGIASLNRGSHTQANPKHISLAKIIQNFRNPSIRYHKIRVNALKITKIGSY